MTPFFSIVIPTLNEEFYLPKILDCLVRQKEKNFDVIIVDAHSQDNTKDVAHSYSSKLTLHYYEVDKKNVSFQRNFGAGKATGKYVLFLDADSVIAATFTKNAQSLIQKRKGLLFIPYIYPDDKRQLDVKLVFNFVNFLIEVSQNIGKPLSSGGSMIFEKDFFHELGGFDTKMPFSEDHDIVRRAHEWGVKARFMRTLRIRMSMRRMRKEGRLTLFYKYILSTGYILFKGKVDKKIYNYEMGGQLYTLEKQKYFPDKHKDDLFNIYLKKANKYFKKIFAEE
jgi:glycosyltransferase involved in cell wall biosynthesis